MRDYGHGPDDRTGDKLMRSLPQRQNRGRPAHLPLFAAIANDPFITPTPSQLPQKCSPRCRKFPLDTNAPDKWVRGPPGDSLQPEAIGAVMEVTKWLKPSISVSRIGDSASVQAATQVNAEQASKRSMCRPTRPPYRGRLIRLGEMSEDYAQPLHRGTGGGMYTRKAHATREAPLRD